MDKNVKPNEDVRKVAPIRVVNLASLQNIKVVNKEMPIRQNRRKSIHQVRTNSDEQIEFIESNAEANNDDNSNSIASSSNSVNRSLPSTSKKISPRRRARETRPNENLMRRVALLKVCAEYMLNELQMGNIEFGENQSLEMLKAQYTRNSRRKHKQPDS